MLLLLFFSLWESIMLLLQCYQNHDLYVYNDHLYLQKTNRFIHVSKLFIIRRTVLCTCDQEGDVGMYVVRVRRVVQHLAMDKM